MKKIFVASLVLLLNTAIAQRLAYIEIEKIINQMPEYQKAIDTIEARAKMWQNEIEIKFQNVDNLYQDYVKNEMMYNEDIKLQKQEGIVEAERKAKEFREEIFGKDGEMARIKEQQLKPLQDKIFKAAERVAVADNYDYIFDRTQESTWIYLNPTHDITEKVLSELGLKNK